MVAHEERDALSLAHIDCDAFYASIEKRDDPSLVDKPLIIGGGKRGVVSTCCYIARRYGVHSAMPMFKALKACPEAVVLKPDMEKYSGIGREIRRMMLDLTPLVEPLSIDEAFLDLGGTERLHQASPAFTLVRFQRRVETEIGVTVSVGLSHNKFLAKIASDLDKPRGFSIIGQQETEEFSAHETGRHHLRRRQGGAPALRAGRHPPARRCAAGRSHRDGAPLRVGGRPPPRARLRPRPAQREGRSRDEEHLRRDDLRCRSFRSRRASADSLASGREGCGPAAQGRACRRVDHAEDEDQQLRDPHEDARRAADAACSPPFTRPLPIFYRGSLAP